MPHIQLTAKHRPQTFAQVAGQEEIRAILSRAAAKDRVAAAYLFSGTRGVGKTTLARIFAKAINCVTAPTAEPCNQCHHCRQITIGSAPDVAEIDGASNRGIEQARRLKEDVGYAPLECRYKVIIIDEAHMLTKEAFNALLKTMEEPPPRVTFIMATTEPHKFPATIISRSQHYVFKMLSQAQLLTHLQRILELEGRAYEPAATALLARRAAGSVRDGVSLLEQVLTISDQSLRLEDVRRILGLAGSELFQRLLEAMRNQNCMDVHAVLGDLLGQGLDLGFFLRELAGLWRNLFLLRQAGEGALPLLDLPEEEGRMWLGMANALSPTYIHAAWQITLEAQRKVLTSLEPAQSLEMLLLNLTYLPQLVPLDDTVSDEARQPARRAGPPQARQVTGPADVGAPSKERPSRPSWQERTGPVRSDSVTSSQTPQREASRIHPPAQARAAVPSATAASPVSPALPVSGEAKSSDSGYDRSDSEGIRVANACESLSQPAGPISGAATGHSIVSGGPAASAKSWEGFLEYYDRLCRNDQACLPGLRQVECSRSEEGLTLRCRHMVLYNGLSDPNKKRALEDLVQEYFDQPLQVRLLAPEGVGPSTPSALSATPEQHPLVSEFVEQFKAKVVAVEPRQTPAQE